MGELTASIAHEVNQPLAAVVANANAGLRWLANSTPNLDEAREAISRIVRDGKRASDVIGRIRALVKKGDTEKALLDINEVLQEVVSLTHSEIQKSGVVLKLNLAGGLPRVLGDRVQLQQVILNLVMNGIEAMNTVTDRPREMLIRSSCARIRPNARRRARLRYWNRFTESRKDLRYFLHHQVAGNGDGAGDQPFDC